MMDMHDRHRTNDTIFEPDFMPHFHVIVSDITTDVLLNDLWSIRIAIWRLECALLDLIDAGMSKAYRKLRPPFLIQL